MYLTENETWLLMLSAEEESLAEATVLLYAIRGLHPEEENFLRNIVMQKITRGGPAVLSDVRDIIMMLDRFGRALPVLETNSQYEFMTEERKDKFWGQYNQNVIAIWRRLVLKYRGKLPEDITDIASIEEDMIDWSTKERDEKMAELEERRRAVRKHKEVERVMREQNLTRKQAEEWVEDYC